MSGRNAEEKNFRGRDGRLCITPPHMASLSWCRYSSITGPISKPEMMRAEPRSWWQQQKLNMKPRSCWLPVISQKFEEEHGRAMHTKTITIFALVLLLIGNHSHAQRRSDT